MAAKADFNAEEWSLLRQGPGIAGILVATADRGGSVRESLSIAQFYGETRQLWGQEGPVGLVETIIADGPEGVRPDVVAQEGLQRLRRAVDLLERQAGAHEVEDYRRFVLTLAQRVAEAHKEGGFLGIGGTLGSEHEQAALDAIADAVGGQLPT